ncbi:MAG: hybrid sensor histidine kinase/response regulator [Bacteroidales bacterium]|nr:hybrid sensor histidine kinase/response regulator [Bacteroidales bacterium]
MAEQASYRILCVDDNPNNLELLNGILFDQGYVVFIAKNGKQCIDIAKEKKPDLILLDIAMPGMDGFEVLAELKSYPETSEIMVIFVTALTEDVDVVRGLSLGAVDYITKPFNQDELISRISNHLQLKIQRDIYATGKSEVETFMKVQTKLYSSTLDELIDKLRLNEVKFDKILKTSTDKQLLADIEQIKQDNFFVYSRLEKLEIRSKLINNSVVPAFSSFDLDQVIQENINFYMPHAKKKTVTMIYETPGIHMVYADKKLINLVIQNLISNAVKFTPLGGDIIVDVANYTEDPVNFYCVTVYDTGAGLTQEQSMSIFDDKNFMSDESGKKGLGLAIAYHFVKLCFGRIWVESMPGIGSDFKFTIPKHRL